MNIIDRLRNEEVKLLQRLADVRSLIADHEKLQARIEAALGDRREDTDAAAPQATKYATFEVAGSESESREKETRPKRAVSADVREFEAIVTDILSEAPAPMNRNEMFAAVSARGYTPSGATEADQKNTLSSRLTRMPGVANVNLFGKRGYWLASRGEKLTPEPF